MFKLDFFFLFTSDLILVTLNLLAVEQYSISSEGMDYPRVLKG